MTTEIEGVNYGETSIESQLLTFQSQRLQKPIFTLKLDNISTCVIPTTNKDDVEIQFQETADMNNAEHRDDHQLIQITFHFPSKKDQYPIEDEDDEEAREQFEAIESSAEKFHKVVNEIGVLPSGAMGDIIVEFTREQGNFVTPRGKYALQMTSTYVYMQGAQYFYKISYNEINSLFLLPKLDGGRMAFVIALEKPIRQGTQKYQYLVIETHKLNTRVSLKLTEEQITEYEGQLQPEMDMPLCNLIAKVFKVLTKKSVFIPKHFVTTRGGHALRCSLKANEGLLYPLAKAFIFINKPTVYIKFEDIEIIDFKRYENASNSATRNFDLVISLKASAVSSNEPKDYTFASIDRSDYPALVEYFQSKELPVNKPQESRVAAYVEVDDDDDGKADLGSVDSEEEDDDYVAGADEGDDSASGSVSESGEDSDEEDNKKRKKPSSSKKDESKSKKSRPSDD